MRLTHFGHSCLLVEIDGARVLIDPGAFSHGFEELSDLDAIVITHQHIDHVDVERLPQLLEANDSALLLAEPETAAELSGAGIAAEPLHPGDERTVAGVQLRVGGGRHAVIHPDIPRVGNVAVLLGTSHSKDGSGLLLHPGDAYDVVPAGVDVLALPLSAPWAKVSETIDYLRAVRPGTAVPVHDALLQAGARALYVDHCTNLAPEGTTVTSLAPVKPTDVG